MLVLVYRCGDEVLVDVVYMHNNSNPKIAPSFLTHLVLLGQKRAHSKLEVILLKRENTFSSPTHVVANGTEVLASE